MAKILYVEDDGGLRKFYTMAFAAAGHDVTACHDYKSAQQALSGALQRQQSFDLIVSDGQYPGDTRFKKGVYADSDRNGSACLLHDVKLLQLPIPVAVVTLQPDFYRKNPYPAVCRAPDHIFNKMEFTAKRLAAAVPALLAGVQPN